MHLPVSVLALCLTFHLATPRLLYALPDDPFALPKYSVIFLNNLPLLNETAQRWLKEGLQGGQLEFLDQPWKQETSPLLRKEIGTGGNPDGNHYSRLPYHSLEHMKMGPRDSYLCLIPLPLDQPELSSDDVQTDMTPMQSWSLLQPLTGTCLYHRQGWFTYSYCHNEQIRQFRELAHTHPHPSGYKPEEDPEWESYTLGRAPPLSEPGADLTVAQRSALAANIELARDAGSRYLVQRWAEGTLCEKTGKKREVEVQFHCSPTMTDSILFVKETRTCSYVLVIQTPRLCGQPGFKSRLDSTEAAYIRCREIVDSISAQHPAPATLPDADSPLKYPRRKPARAASPPPPQSNKEREAGDIDKATAALRAKYQDVLRILGALTGGKVDGDGDGDLAQLVVEQLTDDGELLIEVVQDVPPPAGDRNGIAGSGLTAKAIADALRAAGYEVKGQKLSQDKEKNARSGSKENAKTKTDEVEDDTTNVRDEL